MDYEKAFNQLVDKTTEYVKRNNLKSMVLGISGGIDSTLVAAICSVVAKRLNIPLIGRSLPSKTNKELEHYSADAVGKAFCDDFQEIEIEKIFQVFGDVIADNEDLPQTPIANGNIKARIRMIYLYNLAGLTGGLVMDTDNKTEHYLGFWTRHGDEGDLNPLSDLWKTDVFGMVEWLARFNTIFTVDQEDALRISGSLVPTDGLGITSSDVEQFGCESYTEVDEILKGFFGLTEDFLPVINKFGMEKVMNIVGRYKSTKYKRAHSPAIIRLEE